MFSFISTTTAPKMSMKLPFGLGQKSESAETVAPETSAQENAFERKISFSSGKLNLGSLIKQQVPIQEIAEGEIRFIYSTQAIQDPKETYEEFINEL
jgi:hypothetical protein